MLPWSGLDKSYLTIHNAAWRNRAPPFEYQLSWLEGSSLMRNLFASAYRAMLVVTSILLGVIAATARAQAYYVQVSQTGGGATSKSYNYDPNNSADPFGIGFVVSSTPFGVLHNCTYGARYRLILSAPATPTRPRNGRQMVCRLRQMVCRLMGQAMLVTGASPARIR